MQHDIQIAEPAAPQRLYYLDALRVLAIFAIVTIHIISNKPLSPSLASPDWAAGTFYDALSRFGVPLFFMISGVLFLDPGREIAFGRLMKRNALRLVTAYAFWCLIDLLVFGDFSTPRGFPGAVVSFFMQWMAGPFHFWFIVALLGLYLVVPFLRRIAAERRLLQYFLLLWLILGLCVESLRELNVLGETVGELLDEANIHLPLGYSGYFMLGWFLHSTNFAKRTRIMLYAGAVAGLAVTFLTAWLSAPTGQRFLFWTEPLRPNTMLMAAGLFVAVKQLFCGREPSPRGGRMLAMLAKCSFGAYLCHMLFVPLQRWLLEPMQFSGSRWLSVPVGMLVVCLLSYALSYVLNRIPFVRRWLV